jgi:hypothetical protein
VKLVCQGQKARFLSHFSVLQVLLLSLHFTSFLRCEKAGVKAAKNTANASNSYGFAAFRLCERPKIFLADFP